jgi:hypothetical protein
MPFPNWLDYDEKINHAIFASVTARRYNKVGSVLIVCGMTERDYGLVLVGISG